VRPPPKAVAKQDQDLAKTHLPPGGPNGDMPGRSLSTPCGRAEPAPPRRGQSQCASPSGERPEMARKAVFSEGRGLRARVARPYSCRGTT